jgi:hypothetical protein
MKSYIVVFNVGSTIPSKMDDLSDDPCFQDPPTWGIGCPPTRKLIEIGDYLFFIAYYKVSNKYYFKGYFKVGDKIPYHLALDRFKNRQNVIITDKKNMTENASWRYQDAKMKYAESNGNKIKTWLRRIKVKEGTFYQNLNDYHEIDNWKCRRVFHCQGSQFRKCCASNRCLLDNTSLMSYKNYIVADNTDWADLGHLWIDFQTFSKNTGFTLSTETPLKQYNAMRCDKYLDAFLNFINKKIKISYIN